MASPEPSLPAPRTVPASQRFSPARAAFLYGLPLGAVILGFVYFGPLRNSVAYRYVSHPVECVEVLMFSMAVAALAAKMQRNVTERRGCNARIVPTWDGKAVPVTQATSLLQDLDRLPKSFKDTWIVRRTAAVLEFLCSRGSANELDDHLRALADNDSLALETSYSLIRFITWAVPILGFLGTVLGITGAISGVTPEVLEQSLGTVTDGLALAFDATALALGLTMLTMFLSFITERSEQAVLEQVDRFADRELAHRFERASADSSEFTEVARRNTQVLVQAVDELIRKQTTLWTDALARVDQRSSEASQRNGQQLSAGLQAAMDQSLKLHAERLAHLEQQSMARCNQVLERLTAVLTATTELTQSQHAALSVVGDKLAERVDATVRLADRTADLQGLEESLNKNLALLTETGRFEEAMHSLTAAIHLLTARATPAAGARPSNRTGTAA
jgi:biopolymer transport protein ExbB/TolQ